MPSLLRSSGRLFGAMAIVAMLLVLPTDVAEAQPADAISLSFSGSVRGDAVLSDLTTWVPSAGVANWCQADCENAVTLSIGSKGAGSSFMTGGEVSLAIVFRQDGVTSSSASGECTIAITERTEERLVGVFSCKGITNAITGRPFGVKADFTTSAFTVDVPEVDVTDDEPVVPTGPLLPEGAGGVDAGGEPGRLPGSVSAPEGIEQIRSYDTDMTIRPDGVLEVVETIDYDFGDTPRHGIFRDIPTRFHYDDVYDRVYPIDIKDVTATNGASDDVDESTQSGFLHVRIGDPDETITGRHTYTITYEVEGAINAFADHDELYWNAVGDQWPVPTIAATATVNAPAAIQRAACFAGTTGSTSPCSSQTVTGNRATFTQNGLYSYEAFTVVVALPKGAVANTEPILKERWSFGRRFAVTPWTGGGAVAVGLLAFGGLGWLGWRVGRDRRARGDAVAVAFATQETSEQDTTRVGAFEPTDSPVEFAPPEDLKPGQVGTLIDEAANPLDVTATIIDLASRGYLRIEEIPGKGVFGKDDWRLIRLKDPADLMAYEAKLMLSLFATGDSVELSALRTTFAQELKDVEDLLYEDAVAQGWFSRRPDQVRAIWGLIGFGAFALTIVVMVGVAMWTHAAFAAIPLVLAGMGMLVLAKRMPARTAKGTGALRRVNGFRLFIEDSEAIRAKFAENNNIFTEYLPYAVVFGATKKWAKAFEGLDAEVAQSSSWYVSTHPFMIASFVDSMDTFAVTTSGTMTAVPASSGSSGFSGGGGSGGGGGGGGGGSW